MCYYQLFIIFLMFFGSCGKTEKVEKKTIEKVIVNDDCVDFVALWSAEDISKRINKDKKWVFLNYTVDLWDAPPSEKEGEIVGSLRASSYARIINRTDSDYLVESPITKVHGWINNSHVKTISRKNPKTRKLCE